MALVKFGGGITGLSGSIGGNTFARNRTGSYVRQRTKPVNPNTGLQTAVRNSLASLALLWRTALSAAERISWQSYASAIAMKNKLGEVMYITGMQHFIRSNVCAVQSGGTTIEAGPTELSLPETDPTVAMIATADDNKLSIAFDNTLGWATEAGGKMLLYQGKPQNVTRNFFAGPWQYAGKIVGATPVAPSSPTLITAPFTVITGQKIFAYVRVLRADGRLSEPKYCNCIATSGA